MRRPFRRPLAALAAMIAVACGGAAPPAKAPETKAADEASAREKDETSRPAADPGPPKPRCDDGSCFVCGAGSCPNGFYCDEAAPGGAACSWVPSCAKSASCECLSRALGSPQCTTTGGGPHVGG